MTGEEGKALGGAASNARSKTASVYIEGAAKPNEADVHEALPLVMVSELPEHALPDPQKFPLWIRGLIFAGGAAATWGIIYALVHRG